MSWDALAIFIVICAAVTVVGFFAARWRRADLTSLAEWGLGGRTFGTVVTWFLLGGDLYTAYTFIAVPALVFGKGALGLYALPYTILIYPLAYVFLPRLWQVAKNRGYITAADYVKDRFDSRWVALIIALTGILATMPYVALQIYGIAVVIYQLGVNVEVSLVVAFLALAVFTYLSGLRAPALIAFVKDVLIWITVIVILVVLPIKLGGFGSIFAKVPHAKLALPPADFGVYGTLVLGSALALFLYPHAITGTLASKGRRAIERNAAFLPAYSFMLGLIALLGYIAVASGLKVHGPYGANSAVPQLISANFPSWFSGFAFAAIAIGAVVPASVMSIAAANLFNRNIYREFFRPHISAREETRVSQIVSLLVKVGALAFVIFGASSYAIYLQLAGGVWILQTLPAVFLALYVRWLDRWSIAVGWAAGMASGTYWLVTDKFASSHIYLLPGNGKIALYTGLVALVINLVVVAVGSLIARLIRGAAPVGRLTANDYDPQLQSAGKEARAEAG